ncbi:S8 family peptidase [Saccharibacillus sp. JS10]|uniref:S8 family peptidase n=1 Tax=Saccharibacillus sp. JS10 TaxID=2950552 RepID=UPI00210BB7E9|nr:S8 family peptidase [Saccharibacillus sp. JS10]MCQ4087126.1 S8 family peptidase [Saccharibacillus sp. JS10]
MFRQKKGKKLFVSIFSVFCIIFACLTYSSFNRAENVEKITHPKPVFDVFVKYACRDGEQLALSVTHDLQYHIYWDMNMISLRTNEAGLAKLHASDAIQSVELSRNYKGVAQSVTSTASLSDDSSSAGSSASKIKQASWGYDAIDTSEAQKSGYTGKGVKIAVLDTGISDQSGLKISGGTSTIEGVPSYNDDNGHGTAVAGIIGATSKAYKGIAPDASVYAVKVMDKDGNGSTQSLAEGIDWAIRQNMDIINMSLSFPEQSSAIQDLLQKATDQGITVIVAAGNAGNAEGTGDTIAFPAKLPEVITVAAIDSNLKRADFSGTGSEVELSAPGVGIISTSVSGKYKINNGTSMATPFVSGMVADLKQAYPNISAAELRTSLQQSAIDLGDKGRDPLYGYGLVSFNRLLGNGSVIQTPAAPKVAPARDASSDTFASQNLNKNSKKSNASNQKSSAANRSFR